MRLISGFAAALLTVVLLAGCSKTAGDNTSYARPPETTGLQIPIE